MQPQRGGARVTRRAPGVPARGECPMTPQDVVNATRRAFDALLKRKDSQHECEYHGFVWHGLNAETDELECIPCARERLDSMTDALDRAWDVLWPVIQELRRDDAETCPNCGEPHVWHGRDEREKVCFPCRYPEA